jgi:hypothetical protein
MITVFERAKTFLSLDRTATAIVTIENAEGQNASNDPFLEFV